MRFETTRLSESADAIAPDGSEVRLLARVVGASTAQFTLPPGRTSVAVCHRTVDEIWVFAAGRGEMWRRLTDQEEIVGVEAGVSITLPVGTHFQFRAHGDAPLVAIGITLPPWPGAGEAYEVEGHWVPTVARVRR